MDSQSTSRESTRHARIYSYIDHTVLRDTHHNTADTTTETSRSRRSNRRKRRIQRMNSEGDR